MKYCSNCGSQFEENDVYCGYCGSKLKEEESHQESAYARQDFQEEETVENVGDSLEKTDNNTLLKD